MDCITCSGHGLNSRKNANFAREITLKRSRGQMYFDKLYSYHRISSRYY